MYSYVKVNTSYRIRSMGTKVDKGVRRTWKKLQQKHVEVAGEHLVVTPGELKKLKQ